MEIVTLSVWRRGGVVEELGEGGWEITNCSNTQVIKFVWECMPARVVTVHQVTPRPTTHSGADWRITIPITATRCTIMIILRDSGETDAEKKSNLKTC